MIEIDASLFVVFAIVWILVFVLSKIFFKPLQRVMNERKFRIQRDRETFEKSMEAYEQKVGEIEADLKEAKNQAQRIKEKFEREALKEREQMLTEIGAETRNQIEEAKKHLEKQVKSLKEELESETRRLAESIEQRLLN